MESFLCEACGTQFASSQFPPAVCPICADERQYVDWSGQRWLTMADLARSHRVRMEEDAGLLGIGTSPSFAINQRALVLPAASLRMLWECTSLVTPETAQGLRQTGIDLIAISHPHFYTAMAEWAEVLGDVPVFLHADDAEWIQRRPKRLELWTGDSLHLADGVTLIRCAGHFPGSTVLHWMDARRPEGALFPGDALQVAQNRRRVSFMYSYPNLIPLQPDAVRAIQACLAGYEFRDVYGFTWGRNILGGGREAVDASFARYLAAVAA